MYHGRQAITPDRLIELDTTEIAVPYGAGNAPVPEQRYRDVVKLLASMTDGRAAYCILAVENEAKVNYAMPVKDGLYDFMQLAKQVTESAASHKKSSRSGAEEWDGPMSLKEMYADCDKEIVKYAADYRINLVAPIRLSDDEIDETNELLEKYWK